MTYYIFIEDGKLNGSGQCLCTNEGVYCAEVTKELYDDYNLDHDKYVVGTKEIETELPNEGVNDGINEGEEAEASEGMELVTNTEIITVPYPVLNPSYEEEKAQKERQRLDALTLTPADVERALYKEKQMDFEDLKTLIAQQLPQVDIKGLAIEFRAKDFYRGAEADGMRLFDVVGQLLGYTTQDIDYLFEHKEFRDGAVVQ